MPVARSAVKTIGRVARSAPIRSAGKALKKEATKAAVETAFEALEGQLVGRKAKQCLKSATGGNCLTLLDKQIPTTTINLKIQTERGKPRQSLNLGKKGGE